MKRVYMEAILRLKDRISTEQVCGTSFGQYVFRINEKDIPFDFEGYTLEILEDEKVSI